MVRNILVHHDGKEYVLPESLIPTEEKLHTAFEAHPELFPTEDLNLGPLPLLRLYPET